MKLVNQFVGGAFELLTKKGVSQENAYHLVRLQLAVLFIVIALPLVMYVIIKVDLSHGEMIFALVVAALLLDFLSGVYMKKNKSKEIQNDVHKSHNVLVYNLICIFMIFFAGGTAYLAGVL
jgi:hypothetical protein